MSLFDEELSSTGSSGAPSGEDERESGGGGDVVEALRSLRYAPKAAPPAVAVPAVAARPPAEAKVDFGRSIAEMQQLRKAEQERLLLKRFKRRREDESNDPLLAEKDRTMGVFVTSAYRETLARHNSGLRADASGDGDASGDAEEDPLEAYIRSVSAQATAPTGPTAAAQITPSPPPPPPQASTAAPAQELLEDKKTNKERAIEMPADDTVAEEPPLPEPWKTQTSPQRQKAKRVLDEAYLNAVADRLNAHLFARIRVQ